jgi:hypothetical protein
MTEKKKANFLKYSHSVRELVSWLRYKMLNNVVEPRNNKKKGGGQLHKLYSFQEYYKSGYEVLKGREKKETFEVTNWGH